MSAKKIFLLRPHHGLCLGFFKGYGYSDAFSRNMAAMLTQLKEGAAVRLVKGQDCICNACPNRNTGCPNAARYDQQVLKLCHLALGQELSFLELERQVRERILLPRRLSEICGDCEWFSICGKGE